MRRRETLVWSLIMLTLLYLTAWIGGAVMSQPARPVKDWCRDQFGTERPMEYCDER